jgi:hypothetical protein
MSEIRNSEIAPFCFLLHDLQTLTHRIGDLGADTSPKLIALMASIIGRILADHVGIFGSYEPPHRLSLKKSDCVGATKDHHMPIWVLATLPLLPELWVTQNRGFGHCSVQTSRTMSEKGHLPVPQAQI